MKMCQWLEVYGEGEVDGHGYEVDIEGVEDVVRRVGMQNQMSANWIRVVTLVQ